MFASGSKARRASLIAAAVVTMGVMATPAARALEGIQGRHAIFYPSLELVYQHDDNYYLSSTNEVSADSFIAHAHFDLEVPGARQYFRVSYQPQYRNVDTDDNYNLPDEWQHFLELQARLRGSSLFSVDVDGSWMLGNLETEALDANRGELVRNDSQFTATSLSVPFKWEGSRQAAKIRLNIYESNFDDPETAPVWFDMSQWGLGAEYAYKFTPLSRFLVGYTYHGNDQSYTDAYFAATGLPSADSDRNDIYFGFDGELGRTTTGHATLGFASLDYDVLWDWADFEGLVFNADITKSFSRYSKLIVGVDRQANPSVYYEKDAVTNVTTTNTYYVSNRVHFNFTNQPQGARVGWSVQGGAQRNGYDKATYNADNQGYAEREDDIIMFRAEIGYHPLEHLSFRLNYRWEDRTSNFSAYEYTDNIVAVQVQFGF